jgi:hypothetical protein
MSFQPHTLLVVEDFVLMWQLSTGFLHKPVPPRPPGRGELL